jgi:hypothetical protein
MLDCWNQNALKRPSFKEITVFLNSQLQKLSKTMSSISSFSSVNSNNELKKSDLDSKFDFKLHKKKYLNDEADDEQNTSDVFFEENNLHQMNKKFSDTQEDFENTLTMNSLSKSDEDHQIEKNDQKKFFEMITRLNLNTNQQQNSDLNSNNKINSDNDNFTDSNYESASSYYSSTSPNHLNINDKNNNIYEKTILSPPSPMVLPTTNSPPITSLAHITSVEANDSATDCDSPLISAKNLLVRMSYDKPFYMNNNNNNLFNIKYNNEILDGGRRLSHQKPSAIKKSPHISASSSASSSSKTILAPKILISPSIEEFNNCVN